MRVRAAALIAAFVCSAPFAAHAQEYPVRPVRFIVPYAAGGGTDALGRMIAQRLAERLGQPVVVDNRPAVDGILGMEIVAKAAPDGYTLLLVSSSFAINPALGKKLPYDTLRDFAPITQTANQQLVLVVHPSFPAATVRELVARLKAEPGKHNYGSASNATALPMELFKALTGTDIQNIPYKGSGALNNDLLAGHVKIAIGGAAASIPHVRAGRLRALGIGDGKRSSFLPDIPTIAEAGVPGFEATVWTGLLAPARTPRAVIERVNREVVRVVQTPEFRQWLNPLGADVVGSSPDEWGRTIVIEIEKWSKIAQRAGLRS